MYWQQFKLYTQILHEKHAKNMPSISVNDSPETEIMETDAIEEFMPSRPYFNSSGSKLTLHAPDFQAFVKEQMRLLQRNPSKAAPYFLIEERIAAEGQKMPHCTDVLYLKYLNAERFRDFVGAESALHEYFDWTAVEPRRKTFSTSGPTNPALICDRSLRYGPLMLAKLNRSFGFQGQALAYIQECITKSQEASDAGCLQHGIVEYCSMLREFDPESFMHIYESVNGSSTNIASFKINLCKALLDCESGRNAIKPLEFLHGQNENDDWLESDQNNNNTIDSMSSSTLSTLYLLHGCVDQSALEAKKLLASIRPIDPVDRIQYGDGSANSESVCIATCNLTLCYYIKGEMTSSLDLLEKAKNNFGCSKYLDHVVLTEGLIMFDRSLHKCDFESCKKWIVQISAISEREGDLCRAILDMSIGIFDDLGVKLKNLLDSASACYFQCRVCLLLAGHLLLNKNNCGSALHYVTLCLKICIDGEYRLVHALALRLKALILMEIREIDSALQCLENAEQLLRVTGHRVELGKLYLIKFKMLKSTERSEGITETAQLLLSAASTFRASSALYLEKEAAFSLAQFYDELKSLDERNHWANRFKDLDEKLHGSFPSLLLL